VAWLLSEWRKLLPYFGLLDFGARPGTRVAWVVRVVVTSLALGILARRTHALTAPLLDAKPLPVLPAEEIEDYRFRLPERTRRELFAEIAAAEVEERKRAIEHDRWRGHLWSREDDRGHAERVELRRLAAKYRISLSAAYLVLDEGIRGRWPGPDGAPLPATSPPLDLRQTW
jgi:hypothetical protein